MSEYKLISPMLDNFDVGDSISNHNGVQCFPAMRKDSDERYIVKAVSIPASQTQLDALLLTGAFPDAASALTYFKEQADTTVDELETLKKLSQLEGFLPYEDWQLVPKDDGIGFDVYMISSYKRSLRKYFQREPVTHLMAVNLGLDLCAALAVCRRCGYLYADLKPNNIYLVNDREFRIGDLGFLKLDSLKYATVPDKYRSQYSAPELQDPFAVITPTIDIYAIGLILYQAYNGGELPFAGDNAPSEKFDAPLYADYEMSEIILKACAPDPADRWQDPIEMGQALVSYMQRNGANDTPIVPAVPIAPVDDTPPSVVSQIEQFLVDDDIDLSDIDLSDIPELEGYDQISFESEDIVPSESNDSNSTTDDTSDDKPDVIEENIQVVAEDMPADETEEDHPEENTGDFENLNFLDELNVDETSPENNISDVDYDEVSDELTEILSQADALVAHPVPEPAVAPEAPEIPEPELVEQPESTENEEPVPNDEIVEEESPQAEDNALEETEESEETTSESCDDSPEIDAATEESSEVEAQVADVANEDEQEKTDPEQTEVGDTSAEQAEDTDLSESGEIDSENSSNHILRNVIIFLLIAIIAVAGFLYYKFIYLQPINSIVIDGDESSMIVTVDSDIDESLLSVVCSDADGTQLSAPVMNGIATFTNLKPNTGYNVTLVMDGFHKLTGDTEVSYSTPAQTNITKFDAVTGNEDGSVILEFEVEGPNSGEWTITYEAEGEEKKSEPVLSEMKELKGLTIGKEYTFTLIPGDKMYITGTNQIKFTASNLIIPQDIKFLSCVDGKLTVTWAAPPETPVENWTVSCYNASGYNESIITPETTAVFENVDISTPITVEVHAAGMSKGDTGTLAANAATISNFQKTLNSNGSLDLTWDSSLTPDGGWIFTYTIEGTEINGIAPCNGNSAQIKSVIPGANYQFTLQQNNGDPVLTEALNYHCPEAQDFSGYGLTRNTLDFATCRNPGGDWYWSDIESSNYVSTFSSGEVISMVGAQQTKSSVSDDLIVILYVFRDQNGTITNYSFQEMSWRNMWSQNHGEFDITQTPTEAGKYTLSVYFNGKLATEESITIQ